jgi:hypothetical protein
MVATRDEAGEGNLQDSGGGPLFLPGEAEPAFQEAARSLADQLLADWLAIFPEAGREAANASAAKKHPPYLQDALPTVYFFLYSRAKKHLSLVC